MDERTELAQLYERKGELITELESAQRELQTVNQRLRELQDAGDKRSKGKKE